MIITGDFLALTTEFLLVSRYLTTQTKSLYQLFKCLSDNFFTFPLDSLITELLTMMLKCYNFIYVLDVFYDLVCGEQWATDNTERLYFPVL